MKTKPLHIFTPERLQADQNLSATQIAEFLDDFAKIHFSANEKRKLISIRMPESLLNTLKHLSRKNGKPYQTQIIDILKDWVLKNINWPS
jgi:predicted DNA binding CopG/RHH family protein